MAGKEPPNSPISLSKDRRKLSQEKDENKKDQEPPSSPIFWSKMSLKDGSTLSLEKEEERQKKRLQILKEQQKMIESQAKSQSSGKPQPLLVRFIF